MSNAPPLNLMTCEGGRPLAERVAADLGLPLIRAHEDWFACGEGKFVIEENIRGSDLYIFQSPVCPGASRSLYDRFVMLLHAVEAASLSDAWRVNVVVPYYPGARQDKRKVRGREGISAGLFARCLQEAGAHRVIAVEIHNEAIGGMFDPSVCRLENIYLHYRLSPWLAARGLVGDTVASPDVGGMERARHFAADLSARLVALSKERDYSTPNKVIRSTLIGDVVGRDVLLVDDIIDTAGSVCAAVEELKGSGAGNVTVACAHPVFSGPAIERLQRVADKASAEGWRFTVVGTSAVHHTGLPDWYLEYDIAPLLSRVIQHIHDRGSVTGAQEAR